MNKWLIIIMLNAKAACLAWLWLGMAEVSGWSNIEWRHPYTPKSRQDVMVSSHIFSCQSWRALGQASTSSWMMGKWQFPFAGTVQWHQAILAHYFHGWQAGIKQNFYNIKVPTYWQAWCNGRNPSLILHTDCIGGIVTSNLEHVRQSSMASPAYIK